MCVCRFAFFFLFGDGPLLSPPQAEYAPYDAAADSMAIDYLHSSMPPALSADEVTLTYVTSPGGEGQCGGAPVVAADDAVY